MIQVVNIIREFTMQAMAKTNPTLMSSSKLMKNRIVKMIVQ